MRFFIFLLGLNLLSLPVTANDQSNGCGISWKIAKRQSLLSSSTRQVTNFVLPNTYSMTSGTSGCQKHSIVMLNQESLYYASANLDQIILESAQGQGAYLTGYARSLGCRDTSLFSQTMKRHFNEISSTQNDEDAALDLSIKVKSIIDQNPTLNLNCQS